jgi:signal peptidase II
MKHIPTIITLVSACIALADGWMKYIALKNLPNTEGSLNPIIDITLHKNPGIAFDIPIPFLVIATITIIIIIALGFYIHKNREKNPINAAFAGTIIIGSLGNLIDRAINGFTTDYILIGGRSVINLADILIVTGVIFLILYTERKDKN